MKREILMTLGQAAADFINAEQPRLLAALVPMPEHPDGEAAPPWVVLAVLYHPGPGEMTTEVHRVVWVTVEWHSDELVSGRVRCGHYPRVQASPDGSDRWQSANPCANIITNSGFSVKVRNSWTGEGRGPLGSVLENEGERCGYFNVFQDDPQEFALWVLKRAAPWLTKRHQFRS